MHMYCDSWGSLVQGQELGFDDPRWSLPVHDILWFYERALFSNFPMGNECSVFEAAWRGTTRCVVPIGRPQMNQFVIRQKKNIPAFCRGLEKLCQRYHVSEEIQACLQLEASSRDVRESRFSRLLVSIPFFELSRNLSMSQGSFISGFVWIKWHLGSHPCDKDHLIPKANWYCAAYICRTELFYPAIFGIVSLCLGAFLRQC